MAQTPSAWQAQKNGRRWEARNTITGEVIELATPSKRRGWPEQHVWLFQDTIKRLAEQDLLGRDAMRVLLYLLGVLDWDNWLVVPQQLIVTALEIQQPNVSRAIATLLHHKILLQAKAPAPRTAYRLNSAFAYKGKYPALQKRRREETTSPSHRRNG